MIRFGFVSNSSSQSFCIYGIYIEDTSKLAQHLALLHEEINKSGYVDITDMADNYNDILDQAMRKTTGLEQHQPYESGVYIGRSWNTIGDDETGGQFKASTVSELNKLLGPDFTKLFNVNIRNMEEAWHDG